MTNKELEKNFQELIVMVNRLATTLASHEVFLGQLDKNIQVHDKIINNLCTNIGMTYDNLKEKNH